MTQQAVEEEQEEVTEVDETSQETIDLAKSMGWVPEENFRGDKSRWVDADTFVEKGMNDLPILRERLKSASNKITTMESDFAEFKTFHEKAVAAQYNRALADLEEKQLQTVEQGDTDEYKRLEEEKQRLARERSTTATPATTQGQVLFENWKQDSAWYEKDDVLTTYSQGVADKIAAERPELKGTQGFLDEIDKRVREAFPDKFGNTNRQSPAAVEAGGRAPARRPRGTRSYENLPPDAKAACDKFVRQGFVTREQYVQDYEWE